MTAMSDHWRKGRTEGQLASARLRSAVAGSAQIIQPTGLGAADSTPGAEIQEKGCGAAVSLLLPGSVPHDKVHPGNQQSL